MRRTLAAAVVAVSTALMIGGAATPAAAVCGDNPPGYPCFCPYFIPGLECMN